MGGSRCLLTVKVYSAGRWYVIALHNCGEQKTRRCVGTFYCSVEWESTGSSKSCRPTTSTCYGCEGLRNTLTLWFHGARRSIIMFIKVSLGII